MTPRTPGGALFVLGAVALALAGAVLVARAGLPERYPFLLELALLAPVLTGAPSDFFPLSVWLLALLPWGLVAVALAVGHGLARRTRAPLAWGVLEGVALALIPGVNLVGGPYVLGELGRAASAMDSGFRASLRVRGAVAGGLHVAALALAAAAFRGPQELLLAAWAARALSVVAFALVLAGMGQALLALRRAGRTPVAAGGRTLSSARAAGASRPLMGALWVGALVATVAGLVAGWAVRSEARACAAGTAPRRMEEAGGPWTSACVLPDGRRHGREQVRAPDGRLLASGEYQEGQPHGTFQAWSAEGVPLEERAYARGQPHGTWKLYGQAGRLVLEEAYVEGKREGASTTFHASGGPRSRKQYQQGLAHGRHATWFESGLVELEGAFNRGRPSGWWVQRDAEGKVVKQWSEGGASADARTAGVSAVFVGNSTLAAALPASATEGDELRGGHTRQWWQERLTRLRGQAEKDPKVAALYQLTLRRAQAHGFAVSEKSEGVELSRQPVP